MSNTEFKFPEKMETLTPGNKPEKRAFSRDGVTVIIGVLIFALGVVVGRELTFWQIRRGLEAAFGG